MSDIIKLLPDSVANQIAAGEVIQRPASAVKELLENAIDAGASDIQLIIKDAGKTLIQVIDNGSGMSAIDARMSFERHATSKIKQAEDLFAIRTMGFRGEALASIAAIAQVELKTKPHEDELGTCLKIEGSKVIGQEVCQCQSGSNLLVKNLFYNVPARRNFLKSNTSELRHVIEEFIRVSVIHPEISMSMIHNDKIVFKLITGTSKARIIGLFGKAYNERLLKVEQKTDQINISGFIGKPEYAKKTRGEQYFFVNGRFIKHPYLNHAVANAYNELMPADAFPTYFLNIDIDPKEIDINIHPTKTEVNFRDGRYVYAVLQAAVKQAVGQHSLTPTIDFNVDAELENIFQQRPRAGITSPTVTINPDYNPFKPKQTQAFKKDSKPGDEHWEKIFTGTNITGRTEQAENKELKPEQLPVTSQGVERREFIQIQNTLILTPASQGLMVIDQQKAHERILYEKYLDQLSGLKRNSQTQLFPHQLHYSPGDAEIIRSLTGELEQLGFVLVALGANGFVVNGIPADLLEPDIEGVLEKIIEDYKREVKNIHYDKNVILARSMAVNASIKEGTKLSHEEMSSIYNRLFRCHVPKMSPDGKKIYTIVDMSEFDKLMKK